MSDKEYENIEDLDTEDLDLDEAKASMGDPSEIAEPVAKSSSANQSSIKMKGAVKKAKLKGVENNKETTSTDLPVKESKFALMNSVIAEMQKMSSSDLADVYTAIIGDADLYDEDDDGGTINEEAFRFDVEGEVEEMFAGQEISEEFRNRASVIFEAAVASKVHEEVESFIVEAAAELEAEKETMLDELVEKTSDYLDYIAGEYIKENELAIEQGIKNDMVEGFMKSMKSLFVEHYIEIPEDKADIVEELLSKVEYLENSLSELTEDNIELSSVIDSVAKTSIFSEVAEDLTVTEKEKLRVFSEAVESNDADDYRNKLHTLKEHYFSGSAPQRSTSDMILNEETDPYAEEEQEKVYDPAMQSYLKALKTR